MIHSFKYSVLCVLGLLLYSCNPKIGEIEAEKLPRIKEKILIERLDSLDKQRPSFLYTKIDTKYSDTNRNVSFKTSLKLKTDSALHTMITYAKIPLVHSLITKDSITVVNKRDKCVQRKDLDFLKENFGVDFNFANIEEIILGLPLDWDPDQKYFQIHDPYNYTISSHRKRKIKKAERKTEDDVIIKYYLNNEANHLKGMEIESPPDSTTIRITYKSRQLIGTYRIPDEMLVEIYSPSNHIVIEMEYDKAEIDEPREMILIIPEGYEECE